MKRSDAFPSNFLSKDDVQAPLLVTIANVVPEPVNCEHGMQNKPVMRFTNEHIKPLIVNDTNWTICENAYGEDSDAWCGHPVEIYVDPNVMFGKRRVGGLRLRVPPVGTNRLVAAQAMPASAPSAPNGHMPPPNAPPIGHAKPLVQTFSDGSGNMLTLEQISAKLVGGFDAARDKNILDQWARWGKQYRFTTQQHDLHEDRYNVALDRLAAHARKQNRMADSRV